MNVAAILVMNILSQISRLLKLMCLSTVSSVSGDDDDAFTFEGGREFL